MSSKALVEIYLGIFFVHSPDRMRFTMEMDTLILVLPFISL